MDIIVEGKEAKVYVNKSAQDTNVRVIVLGENAKVFIDGESEAPDNRAIVPDPFYAACPNALDSKTAQAVGIAREKGPTEKVRFVAILRNMMGRTTFDYEIDEDEDGDVVFTVIEDGEEKSITFMFSRLDGSLHEATVE